VSPRSVCLCAHPLRVHLQHHVIDGKLVPLPLLSLHDISLFQALAEALTTTSKGMVGRRLLQCSDLNCNTFCPDWIEDGCNSIVRALDAAWSATVNTVELAGRFAAKAATKLLNEVKNAAKIAAKVATNALNEVKNAAKIAAKEATNALDQLRQQAIVAVKVARATAEKAAKTATKFVEDVGNAFSELGDEIQCANPPLSPKGRSAVLARQ
jgi:hypothetical protein